MKIQKHIKNCKECGKGFYCKGLDACIKCQLKIGNGFTVPVDAKTNAYLLESKVVNLNYEEVSIEEADRIIKSANLKTLAEMVLTCGWDLCDQYGNDINKFSASILAAYA